MLPLFFLTCAANFHFRLSWSLTVTTTCLSSRPPQIHLPSNRENTNLTFQSPVKRFLFPQHLQDKVKGICAVYETLNHNVPWQFHHSSSSLPSHSIHPLAKPEWGISKATTNKQLSNICYNQLKTCLGGVFIYSLGLCCALLFKINCLGFRVWVLQIRQNGLHSQLSHRSICTKCLPTANSVRLADTSSYLWIHISIACQSGSVQLHWRSIYFPLLKNDWDSVVLCLVSSFT